MDKLVAWSFGHKMSDKNSCPYCGMGKSAGDKHCSQQSKGCCKDSQKLVKLENDQKLSEAFIKFDNNAAGTSNLVFPDYSFEYVSSITEESLIHVPPQVTKLPLFVLNCVYRI
jgi:hypothetical protein